MPTTKARRPWPSAPTAVARALLVVAASAAAGCGASAAEVRAAQTSGYDTDFAVVFSETLEAVRTLYPNYVENPSQGWIKTSWHPLRVSQGQQGEGDDPFGQQQQTPANPNPFGQSNLARKAFFIRFRVFVVGGKPWRVRVEGEASSWEAGSVPVPLHGGDTPPWLKGRTEALQVAIYRRLKQHAVRVRRAPVVADTAAQDTDAGMPVLPQPPSYSQLPPEAAKRIGDVLQAARTRDFTALRQAMQPQFSWSLGGELSADQAIVIWQADPTALDQLTGVLQAGCKASADGQEITCPLEYGTDAAYAGYRAGFKKVGDQWLWEFFLAGD